MLTYSQLGEILLRPDVKNIVSLHKTRFSATHHLQAMLDKILAEDFRNVTVAKIADECSNMEKTKISKSSRKKTTKHRTTKNKTKDNRTAKATTTNRTTDTIGITATI